MPTLHRTVTTPADPTRVYDYLVDFENAKEWDSGTVSCTRVSGDGGPGTVYRNVSKFVGRTVELEYVVEKADRPTFVITGRNDSTTSHDTIVVRPEGSGAGVDYTAEFTLKGPAKYLGPLASLLFQRLGNETARTLESALRRL